MSSTRETTEGYVRRTILPAFGDMPLRKIQHRVDLLDRLYTHLRRCNALCDGLPVTATLDDLHATAGIAAVALDRATERADLDRQFTTADADHYDDLRGADRDGAMNHDDHHGTAG